MTTMDAFTAQIVQLVREMPDEAILALVRNQLGAVFGVASARAATAPAPKARPARAKRRSAKRRPAAKPAAAKRPAPAAPKPAVMPAKPAKPAAKPAKKAARPAKKSASAKAPSRASADRQNLIGVVERIVRSSSGLSASQIAKAAQAPQTRVANALKELKAGKRIFQGGDRRFARYAGDPRTAAQASEHARKTAPGPIIKKKGKR